MKFFSKRLAEFFMSFKISITKFDEIFALEKSYFNEYKLALKLCL